MFTLGAALAQESAETIAAVITLGAIDQWIDFVCAPSKHPELRLTDNNVVSDRGKVANTLK